MTHIRIFKYLSYFHPFLNITVPENPFQYFSGCYMRSRAGTVILKRLCRATNVPKTRRFIKPLFSSLKWWGGDRMGPLKRRLILVLDSWQKFPEMLRSHHKIYTTYVKCMNNMMYSPPPKKKEYPQPSHAFNCVNSTELALFVRLHTYMKTMCMGCRVCYYGRFA